MMPSGQSSSEPRPSDAAAAGPMRFAYADPPYPRQSRHLYREHPDFAGEVDHRELIDRLMADFPDGWALSTSSSALREILELCPRPSWRKGRHVQGTGVRVVAWCKPMSRTLPTSVQYCWEPVLVHGGRQLRGRYVRDYLVASPPVWHAKRRPDGCIPGTKPLEFCYWLFDVLGAQPGDELEDLFPGSGIVGHAWRAWSAQTRLAVG